MKEFNMNNNKDKPVEVNNTMYNWLKKLEETQSWEDCFYYISRRGFGYGFSFNYNNNTYNLCYGDNYKEFLLKALINGYVLKKEPLYKVVDKDDLPLLLVEDNKVYRIRETTPYEKMVKLFKKNYQLTEQQIKDYDERYWAFAVEVEEEIYE